MRRLTAVLAIVALLASVTAAEARGGRTSAQDCEAGSADPDCPDSTAPPPKSNSSSPRGQTQPPPPNK
jgi:hypothetical protein